MIFLSCEQSIKIVILKLAMSQEKNNLNYFSVDQMEFEITLNVEALTETLFIELRANRLFKCSVFPEDIDHLQI